jgi:hypothetical protein
MPADAEILPAPRTPLNPSGAEAPSGGTQSALEEGGEVEIVTWALKVHSEPGVTYPVVAYLAQGTVTPVLQVDGQSGWLQVQLPGGRQTGWITNSPSYVSIR